MNQGDSPDKIRNNSKVTWTLGDSAECCAGTVALHGIHTLTFLVHNCTGKAWQEILQYDVCAKATFIVSSCLHHRWIYREINMPHFDCRAVLQFRMNYQRSQKITSKKWPYLCEMKHVLKAEQNMTLHFRFSVVQGKLGKITCRFKQIIKSYLYMCIGFL